MEENQRSQRNQFREKAGRKLSSRCIFLCLLILFISASAYAVTIIVSYTNDEVPETNEDRLFLYYFDGQEWKEANNVERHPDQNYVKGDITNFDSKVALVWVQPPPTTWRVGNSPNPCPGTTTLLYQVVTASQITIKLFNLAGNEVQTILNEPKEPGKYTRSYDCNWLYNGVYILALYSNGGQVNTFKMSVVK